MSDYHWRHLDDATVKARKEHRCFLCELPIAKGDTYIRRSGVGDGELTRFAMHVACERETDQWTEDDWRYHEPAEFRELIGRSGT